MKKTILTLLIVLGIFIVGGVFLFYPSQDKVTVSPPPINPQTIFTTVTNRNEEVPKFNRVYKIPLISKPGLTMTVESRYLYGGYAGDKIYYFITTLSQSDGSSIIFDPEKVADKVIDKTIIPEIIRIFQDIQQIDKEYRASRPPSFVDEEGITWNREIKENKK